MVFNKVIFDKHRNTLTGKKAEYEIRFRNDLQNVDAFLKYHIVDTVLQNTGALSEEQLSIVIEQRCQKEGVAFNGEIFHEACAVIAVYAGQSKDVLSR